MSGDPAARFEKSRKQKRYVQAKPNRTLHNGQGVQAFSEEHAVVSLVLLLPHVSFLFLHTIMLYLRIRSCSRQRHSISSKLLRCVQLRALRFMIPAAIAVQILISPHTICNTSELCTQFLVPPSGTVSVSQNPHRFVAMTSGFVPLKQFQVHRRPRFNANIPGYCVRRPQLHSIKEIGRPGIGCVSRPLFLKTSLLLSLQAQLSKPFSCLRPESSGTHAIAEVKSTVDITRHSSPCGNRDLSYMHCQSSEAECFQSVALHLHSFLDTSSGLHKLSLRDSMRTKDSVEKRRLSDSVSCSSSPRDTTAPPQHSLQLQLRLSEQIGYDWLGGDLSALDVMGRAVYEVAYQVHQFLLMSSTATDFRVLKDYCGPYNPGKVRSTDNNLQSEIRLSTAPSAMLKPFVSLSCRTAYLNTYALRSQPSFRTASFWDPVCSTQSGGLSLESRSVRNSLQLRGALSLEQIRSSENTLLSDNPLTPQLKERYKASALFDCALHALMNLDSVTTLQSNSSARKSIIDDAAWQIKLENELRIAIRKPFMLVFSANLFYNEAQTKRVQFKQELQLGMQIRY